MIDNIYQFVKVWMWDKFVGGVFVNINCLVFGSMYEKMLFVGKYLL